MSDIQRWKPTDAALIVAGADVEYVTYADHVEALRQAEQRGREEVMAQGWKRHGPAYEAGQRDALAGAVQRVEDMPDWSTTYVSRVEVIAAIKGDTK